VEQPSSWSWSNGRQQTSAVNSFDDDDDDDDDDERMYFNVA